MNKEEEDRIGKKENSQHNTDTRPWTGPRIKRMLTTALRTLLRQETRRADQNQVVENKIINIKLTAEGNKRNEKGKKNYKLNFSDKGRMKRRTYVKKGSSGQLQEQEGRGWVL